MRRLGSIALTAVLAASWATSAAAQELVLRLASDSEFNSNYLGLDSKTRSSVRSLLGPELILTDPHGRFTYVLDYTGQYSWYIEPAISGINSWEQTIDVIASYAVSRRTQISLTERFSDLASIRFGSVDNDGTSDSLDGGQDSFLRNGLGVEVEHNFSPRLLGTLSASHDWIDYQENRDQSDSNSVSVNGQLLYSVTRADQLGGGVGYGFQSFDAEDGLPDSEGQIWTGSVTWRRRFSRDFRMTLSGGPSFIESTTANEFRDLNHAISVDPATGTLLFPDFAACTGATEATCPVPTFIAAIGPGQPNLQFQNFTIGSDKSQNVTFFGRLNVVRTFTNWELTANYTRRQSNAAGDAGTSTQDRLQLRLRYDPHRTWQAYASVGWNRRRRAVRPIQIDDFTIVDDGGFARRVSAIEGRGSRSSTNDQISFVVGASRDLTRQFNGNIEFRYRNQFRRRQNQENQNVDFFVVNLRINYSFAPIRL